MTRRRETYPIDGETTYWPHLSPCTDRCDIDVMPHQSLYAWPIARLRFDSRKDLESFIDQLVDISCDWRRASDIVAEAEARELEDEERCHDLHLKRGGVK